MVNILLGVTGSVATIKLPELINKLFELGIESKIKIVISVVSTQRGEHFFKSSDLPAAVQIHTDAEEWTSWQARGDPVLHIDLVKWADIFLISPLDANSMGKIANGLCDNLLTCVARAWDMKKPFLFCPAMNTKMYEHPVTDEHLNRLQSWGYQIIPVVEKKLMCGDIGAGAMAEINTIVNAVNKIISTDCIKLL